MAGDFALTSPPTIAASAGVALALDGIRWDQYRAPRETGAGLFTVEDAGEYREWAPRGA